MRNSRSSAGPARPSRRSSAGPAWPSVAQPGPACLPQPGPACPSLAQPGPEAAVFAEAVFAE